LYPKTPKPGLSICNFELAILEKCIDSTAADIAEGQYILEINPKINRKLEMKSIMEPKFCIIENPESKENG
jgi:hypothetical protein